ncbi:MAG: T9SS C-terminal target domain-containing protein [Bacteroidetes bacterium]|nr:MAG: T9SS C-terminal target domain-containing protein [Bacteroidota bacterium]
MKATLLLPFLFLGQMVAGGTQVLLDVIPSSFEETFYLDLRKNDSGIATTALLTNLSPDTLQLRWNLEVEQCPADWLLRACDPLNCQDYNPTDPRHRVAFQPAFSLLDLAPGQQSNLDFMLWPTHQEGLALARVNFFDARLPDAPLSSAQFSFEIKNLPHGMDPASPQLLRLYPNPATNYVFLTPNETVRRMTLYNIIGKRVKEFEVYPGKRYDISDLPGGIYLVSLLDADSRILKTIRLSKKVYRP